MHLEYLAQPTDPPIWMMPSKGLAKRPSRRLGKKEEGSRTLALALVMWDSVHPFLGLNAKRVRTATLNLCCRIARRVSRAADMGIPLNKGVFPNVFSDRTSRSVNMGSEAGRQKVNAGTTQYSLSDNTISYRGSTSRSTYRPKPT